VGKIANVRVIGNKDQYEGTNFEFSWEQNQSGISGLAPDGRMIMNYSSKVDLQFLHKF
jgi:hypothetical protein